MIPAMPRPPKPYLHHYKTRHGSYIWYVRKPGGRRVRIRGSYDSPEFQEAYWAAINGDNAPKVRKAASGSLAWLWERYREVGVWTNLSSATRRQRENIMSGVLKEKGAIPFDQITKANIIAGREKRSKTPAQARNFLDTMRGLFRWAVLAGEAKIDPTKEVLNPERPPGAGFVAWTEDDVDHYYARWPLGTKERVWIDVLLFTGLRRGDAVRLGRQHIKNGVATLRTEKSGDVTEVCLPILPELAATLAAGPCGDLAFICGKTRKPLTKESFGNVFKRACEDAGVKQAKKAAHGLRKIGATRAADNGATEHQLMAIFGWTDPKMAAHYTKTANRRRLSKSAMYKLQRSNDDDGGAKIPSKVQN